MGNGAMATGPKLPRTFLTLPDLPVVKPLTSMAGTVGGADQDFDVPGDPVMDPVSFLRHFK